MTGAWERCDDTLPPEGESVLTKIDDAKGVRNVQILRRYGRAWFADGKYIYYTPTHWRPIA